MLGRVRGCRAVAGAARGGAKNPVRQAACVAECDTVRNLIYMIGDGMGLAHVTMLQIAEGYDNPVSFMRAENVALIKSYSRNNRVTDSAAAGTALATASAARATRPTTVCWAFCPTVRPSSR